MGSNCKYFTRPFCQKGPAKFFTTIRPTTYDKVDPSMHRFVQLILPFLTVDPSHAQVRPAAAAPSVGGRSVCSLRPAPGSSASDSPCTECGLPIKPGDELYKTMRAHNACGLAKRRALHYITKWQPKISEGTKKLTLTPKLLRGIKMEYGRLLTKCSV